VPPDGATPPAPPRNAVVVLLDSLNRSAVGAYGGSEVETPSLDRLARRSVRFDDHRAG
jgi:arylsulfatase A-like enzyme